MLSTLPCATQYRSLLDLYFKYSNVYISVPKLPIYACPHTFPPKFVFCVCEPVSHFYKYVNLCVVFFFKITCIRGTT